MKRILMMSVMLCLLSSYSIVWAAPIENALLQERQKNAGLTVEIEILEQMLHVEKTIAFEQQALIDEMHVTMQWVFLFAMIGVLTAVLLCRYGTLLWLYLAQAKAERKKSAISYDPDIEFVISVQQADNSWKHELKSIVTYPEILNLVDTQHFVEERIRLWFWDRATAEVVSTLLDHEARVLSVDKPPEWMKDCPFVSLPGYIVRM